MQREDDEPMKTLQGFNKMNIDPGKEVEIEITLNSRSFSSWSTQKEGWEIKQGTYQIMIGDSSDNILLQTEIIL
jgi:beta-glucosidase